MKIEREFDEVEIDIPDLVNACVKNYLSGNAILVFLYVFSKTENTDDNNDDDYLFTYKEVEAAIGLSKEEVITAFEELHKVNASSLLYKNDESFEAEVCLDFERWRPNIMRHNFSDLIHKLAELHITESEFQLIAVVVKEGNWSEFPLTTLLRTTGIPDKNTLDATLQELQAMDIIWVNPCEWEEELVIAGCHEQFSYQLGINHHFEQWGARKLITDKQRQKEEEKKE